MEVISIIAILVSPLIAVVVGQILQNRKEKNNRIYANKLNIFAMLVGARHSKVNNDNFITAINQIPIVFNENKKVLEKLERFIKTHKDRVSPLTEVIADLETQLYDLVVEIGKDMNYQDLDNYSIKSFYNPDAAFFRNQATLVSNKMYVLENEPILAALEKKISDDKKKKDDKKD